MTTTASNLQDQDYVALADFRAALRGFLAFSEDKAAEVGLTPQQHQALLAIRAAGGDATIGHIAERLVLKPHTVSELIDRLEARALIERHVSETDRRKVKLVVSDNATGLLAALSATHREEIRQLKPLLVELLERFG